MASVLQAVEASQLNHDDDGKKCGGKYLAVLPRWGRGHPAKISLPGGQVIRFLGRKGMGASPRYLGYGCKLTAEAANAQVNAGLPRPVFIGNREPWGKLPG